MYIATSAAEAESPKARSNLETKGLHRAENVAKGRSLGLHIWGSKMSNLRLCSRAERFCEAAP